MGSSEPVNVGKMELNDSGCVQDESLPNKSAMENGYTGQAQLLDLSDDVLLCIFQYCGAHDLKALGYSCARLGSLVLDRSLWTRVDHSGVECDRARLRWLLTHALHAGTRELRLTGLAKLAAGCLGHVNRTRAEVEEERARRERRGADGDFVEEVIEDLTITEERLGDNQQNGGLEPPYPLFRQHARLHINTHPLPRQSGSPSWPDSPPARAASPPPGGGCAGPQFTLTPDLLRDLADTCPHLHTLSLDYCNINCKKTTLSMFPPKLKKLSLRGTKCYNLPLDKSFLFKIHDYLPLLEYLDLSECAWLEPASLLPLSKAPALCTLLLRACPAMTEFVAYVSLATRYGFRQLKVLDFRGSPVGDSEVSALGWLPALCELHLAAPPPPPPPGAAPRPHRHYRGDPAGGRPATPWEQQEPEYYSGRAPPEAESPDSSAEDIEGQVEQLRDRFPTNHQITIEVHAVPQNIVNPIPAQRLQNEQEQQRQQERQPEAPERDGQPKRRLDENDEEAGPSKRKKNEETESAKDENANDEVQPEASVNQETNQDKLADDKPNTQTVTDKRDDMENDKSSDDKRPTELSVDDKQNSDAASGKKQSLDSSSDDKLKKTSDEKQNSNAGTSKKQPELSHYEKQNHDSSSDDKPNSESSSDDKNNADTSEMTQDSEMSTSSESYDDKDHSISSFDEQRITDTSLDEQSFHSIDMSTDDNKDFETSADCSQDDVSNPGPSTSKSDEGKSNNNGVENNNNDENKRKNLKRKLSDSDQSDSDDDDDDEDGKKPDGDENKEKVNDNENNTPRGECSCSNQEGARENQDGGAGRDDFCELNININAATASGSEYSIKLSVCDDHITINKKEKKRLRKLRRSLYKKLKKSKKERKRARKEAEKREAEKEEQNAEAAPENQPGPSNAGSSNEQRNPQEPVRYEQYVRFRQNQNPVVISCPAVQRRIDNDIRSRHHVLYVNLGQQLRLLPNQPVFHSIRTRNFSAERLEVSNLVTDSAIRRFGRAEGEDINIVNIGNPIPGIEVIGGRPNRSNLRILTATGYSGITNRSLIHLATAAPHLRLIDFSNSGVTEAGVENFRSLRPECEVRFSEFKQEENPDNSE